MEIDWNKSPDLNVEREKKNETEKKIERKIMGVIET